MEELRMFNSKEQYKLKVGDITVRIEYSSNGKNFEDCIINILESKNLM